jgi:hypothetical protein
MSCGRYMGGGEEDEGRTKTKMKKFCLLFIIRANNQKELTYQKR